MGVNPKSIKKHAKIGEPLVHFGLLNQARKKHYFQKKLVFFEFAAYNSTTFFTIFQKIGKTAE
ncbi:hypothetical protein [Dyadobacter jejuensis]|uniref:hypothetical protein n=1 Tax=Dyadobacter jejuensis TaxID=1082580 RepID=UPI000D6DA8A3|nr:hypothetical protein [Dyadobacter jejuensis]